MSMIQPTPQQLQLLQQQGQVQAPMPGQPMQMPGQLQLPQQSQQLLPIEQVVEESARMTLDLLNSLVQNKELNTDVQANAIQTLAQSVKTLLDATNQSNKQDPQLQAEVQLRQIESATQLQREQMQQQSQIESIKLQRSLEMEERKFEHQQNMDYERLKLDQAKIFQEQQLKSQQAAAANQLEQQKAHADAILKAESISNKSAETSNSSEK